MMNGTRGFRCVMAAALAVMVCLPLGGCSIEIKGGKRDNAKRVMHWISRTANGIPAATAMAAATVPATGM